ncbi:hypothetical protein DYB30_003402 [Aphanomyces astaci]|uniref:Sfi1 spindle body domain-containing protein n=1 Tax=Aphanomyces astaci TaxID=112090 RepID=A0A397DLB6_APHAT|nr:hypothetical protein DYB30_003402 [Aphanomyces astaci]
MSQEDARSAIYRLDDVVRRMAAAWDAETRLHRDKLLEMSIAHDQMQAKVGAQALECLLQRTTVYCLNRWKAFVSTTKATKAKVSHVMAVLQANHIALVYDRWKQFHRMHQARKQLCAKWHHIHASTLVTTAFRAWAANAADRRKLATMLQLFGVSMVRKTYEFVWRQWHRTASERKQARMLWTRAVARLSKHWYKVGLRRWKDVADAIASAKRAQFRIQALDHATNTVQRKWNHIVCRQVLVWWRDNVSSIRRQRELLKRCATRFQHFAVGRVFEVWRENAWVQRRDRFACDLLVGLCLRHCVQSAWVQWRQHRLVSAQLETQRMHEAYRVTQQELLAAKTAIESLTSHVASSQAATASLCDTTKQLKLQLQASKCMHMFQSTIRTSFSEWKRVTAMFKQTKGNVRLIVRRMQRLHQAMVLDMWKAFIIRRHAKAGRADRQYRKVLVQFTRRVLRHSWTRWQLGLAKWTKHTLESQMAKDRDEWERERGEVGRRAMAMEEQVQQVCAELAGKERALQDLQTHLLAVEISRDVKYHHHHVVEDKLTTVLTSTRQAMTLQLNLRRAWSMWTALVRRRRVTRERAFEWLEIKQRAQLETLFSSWKAHLVAYRRRLRLELKFKRRRLDQAVERWRVRTASRLQLKKCAADLRAKWGLSLMAWRLRWVHVRKTTWGFQRWKLAAIQHAWRAKLQYTVGQLDQAHQLLLDEQEAVLAQREHMVLPLRATWRALSQAKTLEQLFDAVASPCLADTSMLYLVDPVKQELWSIVKKNTQMVTAPVHVGIAGFVVGSGATCRTPAVAQDTRFHPLVDQRDAAEATVGRLRDQLQQKELDLQAQIHALERQAASDQHERKAKEDELHHVIWTLQNEHQLTRARDLISSAWHAATTDAAILPPRQPDDSSTTHVLLAEIQALKNQLVRAETDAQFLSKTIRVAIKYEGNLPDVMIAEVKRIGRRLKKATSE